MILKQEKARKSELVALPLLLYVTKEGFPGIFTLHSRDYKGYKLFVRLLAKLLQRN